MCVHVCLFMHVYLRVTYMCVFIFFQMGAIKSLPSRIPGVFPTTDPSRESLSLGPCFQLDEKQAAPLVETLNKCA